ncbi:MAG: cytidine deaminase [Marinilabiliales bacterium]|nr:MAG: cytidine deaminase [Marinilabiliales bacterium]
MVSFFGERYHPKGKNLKHKVMKTYKIEVPVQMYDGIDELNSDDRKLLEDAITAMEGSYAPYSKYHVGAAVLLENGEVFPGSNQENVAYPSGLCAERVALFAAGARYPDVAVKAIAVTADAEDFEIEGPVTPCGACRQVMAETETRHSSPVRVIMGNKKGKIYAIEKIGDLLPLMFEAEDLKKSK